MYRHRGDFHPGLFGCCRTVGVENLLSEIWVDPKVLLFLLQRHRMRSHFSGGVNPFPGRRNRCVQFSLLASRRFADRWISVANVRHADGDPHFVHG